MRLSTNAGIMRQRIINTVLFLFVGTVLFAQSEKVEQQVNRLNAAIFRDKDSVTLDRILNETVTYGHSSGKIENRSEMIAGAVHNKASYRDLRMENFTVFFENKKTAIVRHILRTIAIENDKESPLNLNVMQVWVKKKGEWKLAGRQSVRF